MSDANVRWNALRARFLHIGWEASRLARMSDHPEATPVEAYEMMEEATWLEQFASRALREMDAIEREAVADEEWRQSQPEECPF